MPPSNTASLRLDIRICYPDFQLDVGQDVALDGVTALFGPSGAGKSTLLRIIAGLETHATGTVRFGSELWSDTAQRAFVPPHRRGISYLFQQSRLFPHLHVADNLRYAVRRAPRALPGPNLDEIVAALDLAPLLARRPAELSGGEAQRVALGRALLSRPRLLLLDEPVAALDVGRKREILPYVQRLLRQTGVPAIYVTHAIDEAALLADRMVVLDHGAITASGDIATVLERLDVQRLAGRFEAGVLIEAPIVAHDRRYHLTQLDLHGQPLTMPMVELPEGRRIRIRIRARDVALAIERPVGISVRNVLLTNILEIVEEPRTAFAEVLLDAGGTHLRARLTRLAVAELGLAPNRQVFALIKSVTFDRRSLLPALGAPSGDNR
ncbi:MAG: molybdenum ABC transporter ATP-binding protein [Gammaproteobacteria bacterium]|nr:molybdenum ABC transporter ATP-binding protein [Gammaproteobacteria bacterium]